MLFDLMPARVYRLASDVRSSLMAVREALGARGFTVDSWDFDEAWAGRDGWRGFVVREGDSTKAAAMNALVEGIPVVGAALLAAVPGLRKQHGLVRVAVIARDAPSQAGCDLICAVIDKDGASSLDSADAFAATAFNEVAAAFSTRGARRQSAGS